MLYCRSCKQSEGPSRIQLPNLVLVRSVELSFLIIPNKAKVRLSILSRHIFSGIEISMQKIKNYLNFQRAFRGLKVFRTKPKMKKMKNKHPNYSLYSAFPYANPVVGGLYAFPMLRRRSTKRIQWEIFKYTDQGLKFICYG
jgi:hypothetical protein